MKYTCFIKQSILSLICTIITVPPLFADYEIGDGTANNPFQITTAEELDQVRDHLDKHFILMEDIDLSDINNWEPIGHEDEPFMGHFDGNRHTISNLRINREESDTLGLFGNTDSSTIENTDLRDVNITGGRYIGALAGNISNTTVRNSSVTGFISGGGYLGGLIGNIVEESLVSASYADVDVIGEQMIGGLIGALQDGGSLVKNTYAMGSLSASDNVVGGLIGLCLDTLASYSYATGTIISAGSLAGGLNGISDDFNSIEEKSYWNTETTNQESSYGGEARTTEDMTYPFGEDTYVDWDFDEIWVVDENTNNGYPFFRWELEDPITSIHKEETNNFNVYPNPVQDRLHIEGDFSGTQTDIQLYNQNGSMVLHQSSLQSSHIDMGNLPEGLYIIRLVDQTNGSTVIKETILKR